MWLKNLVGMLGYLIAAWAVGVIRRGGQAPTLNGEAP